MAAWHPNNFVASGDAGVWSMSDSESDLSIPDLPNLLEFSKVPRASTEELQRKEIEALRHQVLEMASENSILSARMRDVDEVFTRRLGEQVMTLTASREAQALEIDSAKRELSVLQRKYAFLERENKTLAVKCEANGSKTRHVVLGDGFVVKRRRPDPDNLVQAQIDHEFREKMSECKLANGNRALHQLDTDSVTQLLSFNTANGAASYLIESLVKFDVYLLPSCLKLLGTIIEFTDMRALNLNSLNSAISVHLKELKPFPSIDEPGNVYLNRDVCYSLTTLLYALDLLIFCCKSPPYPLIEQLLRNGNPLVSIRGLMLLQLSPFEITEKNIMTDVNCTSFTPSFQLLFRGLWDESPLDATSIPEYSKRYLHLEWPKRQIKIVCNELARSIKQEFNFQIVRGTCRKQTVEPKLWHKVVSILLKTEDYDSKLTKSCVRFIWKCSPMPNDFESRVYATSLVTKLSRIASLTADADTNYWCQEILRQIISPQEDEILRGMMFY